MRLAGAVCVAGALLLAPAAAPASTTTIGSDLLNAPTAQLGGGSGTTFVQTELFTRPLQAPTDGVVVRWRIRTGADPEQGTFRLRLVRQFDATQFEGVGTSTPHKNSTAGGIETFPTRLPTLQGDYIGMDLIGTVTWRRTGLGASASDMSWDPPLADGDASAPDVDNVDNGVEFLFNADIETDADNDEHGDDTQDNCPGVANVTQLNSDGAPDGGDACDPNDDNDSRPDAQDNCPTTKSPSQADFDHDGRGDPCDLPKAGACANGFVGTAAGETIRGSAFGDRIRGLGGPDVLRGLAGRDCLIGGKGGDVLRGGGDKNVYRGGPGKDRVFARNGVKDDIDCGKGADTAKVDSNDPVKNCETVKRP